MSSELWEPEGRYQYSKMFYQEPEGRYCCTKSMVIAPFWLSTDDVLTAILSTCHLILRQIHVYTSRGCSTMMIHIIRSIKCYSNFSLPCSIFAIWSILNFFSFLVWLTSCWEIEKYFTKCSIRYILGICKVRQGLLHCIVHCVCS